MSENSAVLALPYIQQAQAQKHVTHNEALRVLDVLVQPAVQDRDRITPPAAPARGDRHLVAPGAVDDWAGRDGAIAVWEDSAWSFYAPAPGWGLRVLAEGAVTVVYDGTVWGPETLGLTMLGINTGADTTNRLAVASQATLLSHAGAGHQLKINKFTPSDTASVLFQSNWTGHAEMGLAGDTEFAIKVSADGATWAEALRFAANGTISGQAVQQTPADTTPGRLMRADYGYGRGNLVGPVSQSGGLPTGAVVERGTNTNGTYVRWADGTQMCWHKSPVLTCNASAIGATGLSTSGAYFWTFPALFAASPFVTEGATRVGGSHSHFAMKASGASDSSPSQRAFQLAAVTGGSGTIDMVAHGRWY
jgi:hypothetical protein